MKKIRVAMVVIDANEVAGDFLARIHAESPSVHPVIWSLAKALALRNQIELEVIYGSSKVSTPTQHLRDGVSCVAIPPLFRRGSIMGMGMFGRGLGILHYLKRKPFDLVHGQGTEREAGWVASCSHRPSLITLHGNFLQIQKIFGGPPWGYYPMAARLERWALNRIGGIVCISRYVREITSSFHKEQFVIPNAVRHEFLSTQRGEATGKPPRVVYMGTFDRRKRPDAILKICELAWGRGAQFTLHFYGGSGFGQTFQSQLVSSCEAHVQNGRVFFEGFAQEPWKVWAGATVGISASIEESFGMNVLEAMATGTPVMAPAVGGILDIVEDGVSGFLYPPENLTFASDVLLRLLRCPSEWDAISRAAQKRATAFSSDRIAERTEEMYRKFLKRNHP
jgi:glycosyltransferase involved in cell wall biosynthesis